MPDCAVPKCSSDAGPGKLMCLKHWRMVPRSTQRRVNETWSNVRNDADAYREARADAIASVSNVEQESLL